MTYKETEFPQVLEILNEYAKKGIPLEEVVLETYNLYKKVPIYIGIVASCVENLVNECKYEEIKKGDRVVIVGKSCVYKGTVDKIYKNGKLKLKNLQVVCRKDKIEINIKKQKVYKFNKNVLEKMWPSLSFKSNK